MKDLPDSFIRRIKAQLGEEGFSAFIAEYEKPPVRGLRVNTLKTTVAGFAAASPWPLKPSPLLDEGFVLAGDPLHVGAHPYHAAGLFYMQEPSAMSVIAAAGISTAPELRVLDMCAAPGGKAGGVAARMAGQGLLIANEIVPNRARTLAYTLERLGVANAAVTCAYPDDIAKALPDYFDVVLVDAPCSGEGMFRKDDTAVSEWSQAHVKACAQRQLAILESAYTCVAGGGRLVYSTCTFSTDENEGVVETFLLAHADMRIEHMQRLWPHTCAGEGHFIAVLQKRDGVRKDYHELALTPCRNGAYVEFCDKNLVAVPAAYELPGGRVLCAAGLPAPLSALHIWCAGTNMGELVRGRFIPAHALALRAEQLMANMVTLDAEDARLSAFLRGESIPCDTRNGWCAVSVEGHALGLGKAVDGVIKNHIPKGLRVSA